MQPLLAKQQLLKFLSKMVNPRFFLYSFLFFVGGGGQPFLEQKLLCNNVQLHFAVYKKTTIDKQREKEKWQAFEWFAEQLKLNFSEKKKGKRRILLNWAENGLVESFWNPFKQKWFLQVTQTWIWSKRSISIRRCYGNQKSEIFPHAFFPLWNKLYWQLCHEFWITATSFKNVIV